MQEKNENPFMIKRLQDGLAKLISEEYLAYKLYMTSKMAVCRCGADFIDELFTGIAGDELNDHMKELVKWCREYNYEIPFSDAEINKAADKRAVKQLKDLEKNQDAAYYICQGIMSETLAIESYRKILEYNEVCQFTDLQALLWHIYYDETEHLEKLNTARIACEAGADLVMD